MFIILRRTNAEDNKQVIRLEEKQHSDMLDNVEAAHLKRVIETIDILACGIEEGMSMFKSKWKTLAKF